MELQGEPTIGEPIRKYGLGLLIVGPLLLRTGL